METRQTQTITYRPNSTQFTAVTGDDEMGQRRLDVLLELNREIADERSLYGSERERLEAGMMLNPLGPERAFAYYGLMLGTFPPAAIFARWLTSVNFNDPAPVWVMGILVLVILVSGFVGSFSGKLVGRAVRNLEKRSWSSMVLIMPFVGLLWGIVAGGAGGLIIFVIGAFFGAFLGGIVGALALPAFVVLHRLLKRGDVIDQRHFLPLAFGVTLTICSFILGL
jgi:hypothetical protein